jgi:hypothetical protein
MFIDYFEPSAFLNVTAPKFPIYESKEEENPDEPSVRDGVSDSYLRELVSSRRDRPRFPESVWPCWLAWAGCAVAGVVHSQTAPMITAP